jgi:hypothetical protein
MKSRLKLTLDFHGHESISSSSPISHHQYNGIGDHEYCFLGLLGKVLQQITNNLSQNTGPHVWSYFLPSLFSLGIFSPPDTA